MTTKTNKKPQCEIVLDHLRNHGYITQLIAGNYGVKRLASRITDLRNAGFQIASERRTDDEGTRYAYYTLTEAYPLVA